MLAAVPVVFWFHVGTVPLSCAYGNASEDNVVNVEFSVAVMLDAVPVVFWLNVGKLVRLAALNVGAV
jgi:hypothetical protein